MKTRWRGIVAAIGVVVCAGCSGAPPPPSSSGAAAGEERSLETAQAPSGPLPWRLGYLSPAPRQRWTIVRRSADAGSLFLGGGYRVLLASDGARASASLPLAGPIVSSLDCGEQWYFFTTDGVAYRAMGFLGTLSEVGRADTRLVRSVGRGAGMARSADGRLHIVSCDGSIVVAHAPSLEGARDARVDPLGRRLFIDRERRVRWISRQRVDAPQALPVLYTPLPDEDPDTGEETPLPPEEASATGFRWSASSLFILTSEGAYELVDGQPESRRQAPGQEILSGPVQASLTRAIVQLFPWVGRPVDTRGRTLLSLDDASYAFDSATGRLAALTDPSGEEDRVLVSCYADFAGGTFFHLCGAPEDYRKTYVFVSEDGQQWTLRTTIQTSSFRSLMISRDGGSLLELRRCAEAEADARGVCWHVQSQHRMVELEEDDVVVGQSQTHLMVGDSGMQGEYSLRLIPFDAAATELPVRFSADDFQIGLGFFLADGVFFAAEAGEGGRRYVLGSPSDPLEVRETPEGASFVAFADAEHGLAAAATLGHVWSTRDGGRSWEPLAWSGAGDPAGYAIPADAPAQGLAGPYGSAVRIGPLLFGPGEAMTNMPPITPENAVFPMAR